MPPLLVALRRCRFSPRIDGYAADDLPVYRRFAISDIYGHDALIFHARPIRRAMRQSIYAINYISHYHKTNAAQGYSKLKFYSKDGECMTVRAQEIDEISKNDLRHDAIPDSITRRTPISRPSRRERQVKVPPIAHAFRRHFEDASMRLIETSRYSLTLIGDTPPALIR